MDGTFLRSDRDYDRERFAHVYAAMRRAGVDFLAAPDAYYDDPELRERIFPTSRLQGVANVLVFAGTDAASGVRNALKMRAGGLEAVAVEGLTSRVGPTDVARGLLTRRLLIPAFTTGNDRRAGYLGFYRKAPA